MKKKNTNKFYFTILFSIAVLIGVGYAFLNNTLNVFGNVGFTGNKWDVHFENLVVQDGSVTNSSSATIDTNKTTVHFTSALAKPGDYFEFYVDVVNVGNIDAKLNSVVNLGLSDEQKKYLSYTVLYSDDTPIVNGDVIKSGEKDTVKVKIQYRTDITALDLPTENGSIELSFSLNYVQAD